MITYDMSKQELKKRTTGSTNSSYSYATLYGGFFKDLATLTGVRGQGKEPIQASVINNKKLSENYKVLLPNDELSKVLVEVNKRTIKKENGVARYACMYDFLFTTLNMNRGNIIGVTRDYEEGKLSLSETVEYFYNLYYYLIPWMQNKFIRDMLVDLGVHVFRTMSAIELESKSKSKGYDFIFTFVVYQTLIFCLRNFRYASDDFESDSETIYNAKEFFSTLNGVRGEQHMEDIRDLKTLVVVLEDVVTERTASFLVKGGNQPLQSSLTEEDQFSLFEKLFAYKVIEEFLFFSSFAALVKRRGFFSEAFDRETFLKSKRYWATIGIHLLQSDQIDTSLRFNSEIFESAILGVFKQSQSFTESREQVIMRKYLTFTMKMREVEDESSTVTKRKTDSFTDSFLFYILYEERHPNKTEEMKSRIISDKVYYEGVDLSPAMYASILLGMPEISMLNFLRCR